MKIEEQDYQEYLLQLTQIVSVFCTSLDFTLITMASSGSIDTPLYESHSSNDLMETFDEYYLIRIEVGDASLGYILLGAQPHFTISLGKKAGVGQLDIEGFTGQQMDKLIHLLDQFSRSIPLAGPTMVRPQLRLDKQPQQDQPDVEHENPNISEAISYIKHNFEKQLTLDDVAAQAHFSQFYFSKLFKREVGMSFIKYLNSLRIEKARSLLLESNFTINEITKMVGFSRPSYFCRVFKEMMGQTPNVYRQMHNCCEVAYSAGNNE